MKRESKRKRNVILLILGLLIVVFSITLLIVPVLFPTYEYYGQVLSANEFLELVNEDVPLHCAQRADSPYFLSAWVTVDYACFNSLEEVDAYFREAALAG
ncbi:MAG TPA: hypothetical protein VER79_10575 [Candidatus Limnocylindrales bacterium]|nr:hypothetical protein [Candidatus Limnocylindrales bacterium]